jgi:hypothetical protein
MNLLVDVQIEGDLKKDIEKIKNNIKEDVKLAIKTLGSSTLKKAEELAEQHLSNKKLNIYKSALKLEQISEEIVVISLDEKAFWIENGRKSGFMDELLKSGVRTSKDGSKYRIIPMQESKEQLKVASIGENLASQLKDFLKSKNVRTGKNNLDLDEKGSPRVGKIHTFNIKDLRDKKQISDNISRISVFQNKNPKTGKVEKSITAFRVISEKHKESGKWVHPGTVPVKILEKAFKWSEQLWQNELFPAIKAKYEDK